MKEKYNNTPLEKSSLRTFRQELEQEWEDEIEIIDDGNTTDIKSFHYLEDGSVEFSILSTKYTLTKLESKVYNISVGDSSQGPKVILQINNDKEQFDSSIEYYFEDKISHIYNAFFNKEVVDKVHKLGYNHKMGILLYGKQGTGKTSMLKKYFNDIVNKHQGIVFNIESYDCLYEIWEFIRKIRVIQNNPIVCFLDEIDEGFKNYGNFERTMKLIMDGHKSIDNSLFFMATNYIDSVPKTIKNRPSRVKYCIEVKGIEEVEKIKTFLETNLKKIGMDYVLEEEELKKLKGSTLDELKQWLLDKIMDIKDNNINEKKLGFIV